MSVKIDFDLRAEGTALPDAFLDSRGLDQLFESTKHSVGSGLRRKFQNVVCREHGDAPRFKISGIYDNEIEQMEIEYHVDTCCQRFLLQVMQVLNQRR